MSQTRLRRTDKAMDATTAEAFLTAARIVDLATVGPDGAPYVVPNLFVYSSRELWVHTTSVAGHFWRNIQACPRVSFTVHEVGQVYPYGDFECDTSISYRSVVGFGRAMVEESDDGKARFFDRLMAKYADPEWRRPRSFYPRLHQVTVFRIAVETITGKAGALPDATERWPLVNRTKSPDAIAPEESRGLPRLTNWAEQIGAGEAGGATGR